MRKIERQMNDAITNGINWQSANTAVTFDPETETSTVYLHGNKIAEVGNHQIPSECYSLRTRNRR
jgi:hypothetical protein